MSAAPSLSASPACPLGVCPGLGNSFPLFNLNTFSVNTAGNVFFKTATVGSCANISAVAENSRSSSQVDSMQSFNSVVSTSTGLSGSISTLTLTAKGTAVAVTRTSSDTTSTFHASQLDVRALNSVVDFVKDGSCFSADNIDLGFLQYFQSLPLISPTTAADSSSWHPYELFLSDAGSHIMMQQQIGSRFQQWDSSESTDSDIAETLLIKSCAEVEGIAGTTGWSVAACAAFNSTQKQKAMQTKSSTARIIQGGTEATRSALTSSLTQATLDAFISAAPQGNEAIGYRFTPIWELLHRIYAPRCSAGFQADCNSVQRAVTLQAAYEGWIGVGCPKMTDGRGSPYQQMTATAPDVQGIYTFGCKVSKTGCRSDDDCHLGGAGSVCYCYGSGCIDQGDAVNLVPGQFHDTVRGDESGGYDSGVNNACYYHVAAHCDCSSGWSGGLPDRFIWSQSGMQLHGPASRNLVRSTRARDL